ncbi:MAG TPA: hypothetical protein VGB30_14035 [bacterium]
MTWGWRKFASYAYVVGWFQDSVDFNPGPEEDFHTSWGDEDAFIARYRPDGIW